MKTILILAVILCLPGQTGLAQPSSNGTQYFPETAFDETRDDGFHSGAFTREWYSGHLAAMDEPSLFQTQENQPQLRFTWLRSFHDPVAVRVTFASPSLATLRFKRADGAGGYDPGNLVEDRTVYLDTDQIRQLKQYLDAADLCAAPPEKVSGLDGAQWIFEYQEGDSYCLVERWSPATGPFKALGLFMLDLATFAETDDQPVY